MRSRVLTAAALLLLTVGLATPTLSGPRDTGGESPALDRATEVAQRVLLERVALALRAAGHHGPAAWLLDSPVYGTHGLSDGPDPVGSSGDANPGAGGGHGPGTGTEGNPPGSLLPGGGPGAPAVGIAQGSPAGGSGLRRDSEQP